MYFNSYCDHHNNEIVVACFLLFWVFLMACILFIFNVYQLEPSTHRRPLANSNFLGSKSPYLRSVGNDDDDDDDDDDYLYQNNASIRTTNSTLLNRPYSRNLSSLTKWLPRRYLSNSDGYDDYDDDDDYVDCNRCSTLSPMQKYK